MSAPSQNLVKWLTRMLADITDAGAIGRFELIHKVEGEHAERDGDPGLEGGQLEAAGGLARHVVEVRRVAADHRAEHDDRIRCACSVA